MKKEGNVEQRYKRGKQDIERSFLPDRSLCEFLKNKFINSKNRKISGIVMESPEGPERLYRYTRSLEIDTGKV